ncbi:pirin family protein [Oceanibacterium hippocampi]|uniref:Quercetin 2,3-dioxygenase n=1 Tax=Oceanibacterium hippocampi TaxID=745714 RepID=A0A1Y5TDS8_9PROT|nr:pirin family protein [Oceanibacterium hippocampi]SLN61823.1 Quercetin 2,3-dioxygenase [Oceanibacterium hippocampi]
MIAKRSAAERGVERLDWLHSKHSFSFGRYFDPQHMGHGPLRVINEDKVVPGAGFGEHGHRDMEIISFVLNGALAHRDTLGSGSVIRRGQIQRMSAGTGIRHSEFNASETEAVHFLQIWIEPERKGLAPGYEEKAVDLDTPGIRLIGSRDGRDGSVTIHRDADLYVVRPEPGKALRHSLRPGRIAWVQSTAGQMLVNGTRLAAGDGAAIDDLDSLEFVANDNAEALLFDMAA